MNTFLVLAYAVGALALGIAALRYLEDRRLAPPVPRLMLLLIVAVAVLAAIEALASRAPQQPCSVALILVTGFVALWKTFAPPGMCFTNISALWRSRQGPHDGPGLQIGPSG